MSSDVITLFDIPTKAPQHCWSFNTWRTRLLLNYKGLDYKTEWIEYPDIRLRLEQHVKPGPDGLYTCPTVIFPDGTYVMDSKVIAPEIEKRYPSPTLKLESPMDARVRDAVIRFMTELRPVYVTQVPKKFLSEASVPFFRTSRAKDLGMSLEQLEADNPKEAVFEKASPALKDLAHILKENSGGPFLEGEQVVYMDFILTGAILFFQDMGSDIFDDFLQSSGDPETYKKYLDAMSPWTKRNDY